MPQPKSQHKANSMHSYINHDHSPARVSEKEYHQSMYLVNAVVWSLIMPLFYTIMLAITHIK